MLGRGAVARERLQRVGVRGGEPRGPSGRPLHVDPPLHGQQRAVQDACAGALAAHATLCEDAAETHDKKITEFTVDIDAPPGLFSERVELARSAAAVAYRRLITDGMLTKDKLAKEKEKQKKIEQNALDKAACLQPQEVLEKWATGFLQTRFGKGEGKESSEVADLVDYGSMISLATLPPKILR